MSLLQVHLAKLCATAGKVLWMAVQECIHCRTALVRKHILDHALCEICANDDQTADHIIFGCAFVREFWVRLGWDPSKIAKAKELWRTETPPRVHGTIAHPLILLCC